MEGLFNAIKDTVTAAINNDGAKIRHKHCEHR